MSVEEEMKLLKAQNKELQRKNTLLMSEVVYLRRKIESELEDDNDQKNHKW